MFSCRLHCIQKKVRGFYYFKTFVVILKQIDLSKNVKKVSNALVKK